MRLCLKERMEARKSWHWLGLLYSFFALVASFGVGNAAQINAVITGVNQVFDRFGMQSGGKWDLVIGILLALVLVFIAVVYVLRWGHIISRRAQHRRRRKSRRRSK